jgi:hypothetical protein
MVMTITAIKSRIAGALRRSGLIRASAALTSSYVPGTVVNVEDFGMLVLLVKYTMGSGESGNAVVLKVEFSTDGTNFYQQTDGQPTVALRTYTFTAVSSPGTYDAFAIVLPVTGISHARVSAKETGVATNAGTCEVKYALGW